jgi:hypothetical protein
MTPDPRDRVAPLIAARPASDFDEAIVASDVQFRSIFRHGKSPSDQGRPVICACTPTDPRRIARAARATIDGRPPCRSAPPRS